MRHPLLKALASQLGGLVFVYALGSNGLLTALNIFGLACLQGLLAATLSMLLLSPRWWWGIHFVFLPAIVLASSLNLPLPVYAASFCTLLLIYWTSFRTQVPLFLSNKRTVHHLANWLPDDKPLRILDVGSGTGSFVQRMARLRPDWQVVGIETAPIPYLLSHWRSSKHTNITITHANFWEHPLTHEDVVYAFLSPVPMPELWAKARKEMRAGTLLVSNSFPIPNRTADEILNINDRRQTSLFIYRMPGQKTAK